MPGSSTFSGKVAAGNYSSFLTTVAEPGNLHINMTTDGNLINLLIMNESAWNGYQKAVTGSREPWKLYTQ